MAKKKKKVVVSPKSKSEETKVKAVKTTTRARKSAVAAKSVEMPFGKKNYTWVLGGIALIAIGMLLMMGGFNEDPNVWDESKIYGFQRTVLAPIVILAGLIVEIFAIFK